MMSALLHVHYDRPALKKLFLFWKSKTENF